MEYEWRIEYVNWPKKSSLSEMNTMPLYSPWDISVAELDNRLRAAGVEPIVPDGADEWWTSLIHHS
jgi:hypothetical protein